MDYETALLAAEQIEADPPKSAAAIRQARYRHNKASRVTPVTPPSPKDLPESSSKPENYQNPNPTPYKPPVPSDEFEAFWSLWPDKRDKGAARRAYPSARRKASQSEILAGVANVTETHAWQSGLRVHASTWLNGERWADPPEDHARAMPMTGGMVAAASDELGYRRALERLNERNPERGPGVVIPLSTPTNGAGRL